MKKRTTRIIVVLIIMALAGWYFSLPAKGKINKAKPASEKYVPTQAAYNGEYLKFEYENKYRTEAIESNQGNILENVRLVGNPGILPEIVVTLRTDQSMGLEEVSGVMMRQLKSDIYEENGITWQGTEGLMFKNKDGSEAAAFFLKSGRSMTLAITRGDIEELKKLVESITWLK